MNERATQMILLARAFEEADRDGVVLPLEQRIAATRRAVIVTTREGGEGEFSRDVLVPSEETLLRRARLVYNALARRIPAIERVLELSRLHSLMGPAVIAVALIAGLSSNVLGPEHRINLLVFPLLALLVWNFVVYAGMVGLFFVRRAMAARVRREHAARADVSMSDASVYREAVTTARDRLVTGLADGVVRLALWRSHWGWRKHSRASGRQAQVTSRAFVRYCALWHRLTGRVLESRVRRRLHLAAVAMVVGVVAGMYLRGIAFEYRVTWESTLLTTAQVQALLNVVLEPAVLVLGLHVPDVAPLRAPGSGEAAIWIHLWTVTALLFVVIPRLALAAVELWRAVRLKRAIHLDLEDGYFRRLLADWRGSAKHVAVLPYSYRPSAPTLDLLRSLMHDFFGARAHVHVAEPLEYGDTVESLAPLFSEPIAEDDQRFAIVLFSLAQSPEAEVHGQLLTGLKAWADRSNGRLLALVDRSDYRKATTQARCDERMRAWTRVADDAGIELVELDPTAAASDPGVADERMAAFRLAMWPASSVTETR
jgi:hypothetical protein